MKNFRVCKTSNNNWDSYAPVPSSYHLSFPGSNTQNRWKTKGWRSNYGVSSGWGRFIIDATNNKIYIDEGGGTLTGTLTSGTYNADTLATEIETQLEAAGAHSYTVNYNDTDNKFEISDDTGTVILKLATTTNAVWDCIGFDTGVDTSTLAEHIADNIRIHTSEEIKIDAGSGNTIDFMAVWIFHHNISSTGTVKIEGSTDDFATIPFSFTMTSGVDLFCYIFDALKQYRYVRYYIVDVDNSDGYIELGRCWVSEWFEPDKPFSPKNSKDPRDPSLVNEAEGGQVSAIRREKYSKRSYAFDIVTAADQETFEEIFRECGFHSEIVVLAKKPNNATSDFEDPEKYSYYCRFTSWKWKKVAGLLYGLKITIQDER